MDKHPNRMERTTSGTSAITPLVNCLVLMAISCSTVLAGKTGTASLNVEPSWRPDPPPHPAEWKERYFVDDHEPPRASAKEKERGFLLYRRPSLSLVFDNSLPHGDDAVARLTCSASPGEYESMTFAVYGLRDLREVQIEIGDLVNETKTRRIPRSRTDVHVARSLYKRLVRQPGTQKEFMYMPSWLSGQKSVDIKAGESAWFWVTVHVPAEARPGDYSGNILVRIGQRQKAILPVEIQVLPIRLDPLRGYSIGYYDYVDHRTLPTWSVKERFDIMRAYGMTSVQLGVSEGPTIRLDERGKLQVDWSGSSIARALEAYKEAGFPAPPNITLAGHEMNACRQLADPRSVRYSEMLLTVFKSLKAECDRQGWPLPTLSPRDEAAGRPDTHHYVAQQLRLMKQAGFFTELNHFLAYPNEQWQAACLPFLDVITLGYSTGVSAQRQPPWIECVRLAHEYGKSLRVYNALQPGSVQPTSWRFLTGWFFRTWGKDCTGSLFYTFDYPDTDPYNDLMPRKGGGYGENVRAWYRPDPALGMPGGPSLTLAWTREGIDDLRYIVTLERLIFRARHDDRGAAAFNVATEAESVLERIKRSFDFSAAPHVTIPRGGTAQSAWRSLEERDGVLAASGEYLYQNGWAPADYDAARQKMVQQILKLQGVLGVSRSQPTQR